MGPIVAANPGPSGCKSSCDFVAAASGFGTFNLKCLPNPSPDLLAADF